MQDAYLVFTLIGAIAIAMATNKVRYDFLAMVVVLVLSLSGVITVSQAFSGFGHPVVILVACLLVVGEMLDKTGVAQNIGESIARIGGQSYAKLLSLLMLSAALLSCVMSSTAVVAIFIPIALGIAQRANLPQSSLLMPVAYAALTSGMITLIATPPNLIINDFLTDLDGEGLGFFEFAPMGLIVLVFTTGFFCLVGKRLFVHSSAVNASAHSSRSFSQLWKEFNLQESVSVVKVGHDSPLVGQSLAQTKIDSNYHVRVLAVVVEERGKSSVHPVAPDRVIHPHDVLVITSTEENADQFAQTMRLSFQANDQRSAMVWLKKVGAAVVLVHPQSSVLGQSVIDCQFRSQFSAQVMGIQRHGEILDQPHTSKLQAGDMLFLVASWKSLRQLANQPRNFVFLEHASELNQYRPNEHKGPIACTIVISMILLKLFNIVPITLAALLAVIAAVLTRCLAVKDVYSSISWSSLVLIAGMLPLATALEVSGGTQMLVDSLLSYLQNATPQLVLAMLFIITTLFTLVLSNTTSGVLMTPIAIGVASALGLSPYPLAVAVLMGASAAFASPVSTSVVTIIVEPGQYRFSDFIKAGLPVTLLTGLITVIVTPLIFPF